jgi:hypothetical protein
MDNMVRGEEDFWSMIDRQYNKKYVKSKGKNCKNATRVERKHIATLYPIAGKWITLRVENLRILKISCCSYNSVFLFL